MVGYKGGLVVSECSYQVRSYKVKHNYDVKWFLESYRWMLQRAINETWKNTTWKEKVTKRRRLIPIIPKSSEFKRNLRNYLLGGWDFCAHYADSAIKQAYSILKSWRRNYLNGRRAKTKPVVKKKFVRVKETLYSYKNGRIEISIRPFEEHLVFDVSNAWFWSRAKGEMGELILNEKFLTITFRFKRRVEERGVIVWDCNERSIDGFNPEIGWIRVDLRKLFHIHRVYELKRQRLQSKASKKPSLRRVLEKYSNRERNRVRDFIHKITTMISKTFKDYVHGFEDLNKEKMLNKSRARNRNIAKSNWKTIISLMGYKSRVQLLSPYNSTKRCSRCGMVNAPKGALYKCKNCGLKIDRQLNACINLYLQVRVFPISEAIRWACGGWGGFTLTGGEADAGSNEPMRGFEACEPPRTKYGSTLTHT
ncbi:MAG: transposase [Candidatus Freyarchaeota archaeon]|nr:transposase [Candidatus Jordarchaeia archaeon]